MSVDPQAFDEAMLGEPAPYALMDGETVGPVRWCWPAKALLWLAVIVVALPVVTVVCSWTAERLVGWWS